MIPIMGARLQWLENDIPWQGDDPGLFLIVPWVSKITGLDIHSALDLTLIALAIISASAAIIQLRILYKDIFIHAWSIFTITIATIIILLGAGDEYSAGTLATFILLPFAMLATERQVNPSIVFLMGLTGGLSSLLRAHSGLGPIIVVLITILFNQNRRWLLTVCLLLGASISLFPNPSPRPIWHNAYIGFGFLNNDLGMAYRDDIAPSLDETEMFHITIQFIKDHTIFAIRTLFAKAGVIIFYALAALNLGLLRWRLIPPIFLIPITIGALPGMIGIPQFSYLTNMIAALTIASIIALARAKRNRQSQTVKYQPREFGNYGPLI